MPRRFRNSIGTVIWPFAWERTVSCQPE
jgi:hypothetical protein